MFIEYGLRAIQKILSRFPYPKISDAGACVGALFYAAGIRRAVAADNLLHSGMKFHDKKILYLSYQNLGRTFFELLLLSRIRLSEPGDYRLELPPDFFKDISGGAIFISAHLGNWELMGKVLVERKIKLAVIVRRQRNRMVDRLINEQRERAGMKVIYDDDPAALVQCVREKYCLALLADQDFGNNAVPVTFFGRDCFAAAGPEFLAKKFNLPGYICLASRERKYGHRFWIERLEPGKAFTQAYTAAIESAIRLYPEQWFWQHRRWKVHA